MTTLIYKMLDFYKEPRLSLVEIKDEGCGEAKFIFEGFSEGELRIGERCIPLKSGEATFKFSRFEEGIISPKLYTEKEIYRIRDCGLHH